MAGLGHWYIELEKQGYWRGEQHTWVNRYVMSGSDPSSSDATTVIQALHDIETKIHFPVSSGGGWGFVEGRAYGSGGGYPFATIAWNTSLVPSSATGFTGTVYPSGPAYTPGPLESCLLIETKINGLNSRGKPIYLRKYIRALATNIGTSTDQLPLPTAFLSAVATAVAPWQTGMGANSWVVIAVSGRQAASAPTVHNFGVNHQVPRGRKRKTSSSSPLFRILNLKTLGEDGEALAEDVIPFA